MEYRTLGRTGAAVSPLCLGTWRFGLESAGSRETTRDEAHALLDTFVDHGGNFIDTSNVYGDPPGTSEQWIGDWLEDHERDDLVLASKVYFDVGEGPNDGGLGRKHIREQIQGTLDRLGTDYLDIYYIHRWDDTVPIETTLATLNDLVRDGRVHHIGASNLAAWQLVKALWTSDVRGWEEFDLVQPRFNAADRNYVDVLAAANDQNIAVCPYSPLDGGFLTGKYDRDEDEPEDSRGDRHDGFLDGRNWDALEGVQRVADELDATPAQVAIRWAVDHPYVTAPIVGARTTEQLEENMAALDYGLSDDQFEHIADAA